MTTPLPTSPSPLAPLTEARRRTLLALTDTFVPALRRRDDPHGFYAAPGSQAGAHLATEAVLAGLPALRIL